MICARACPLLKVAVRMVQKKAQNSYICTFEHNNGATYRVFGAAITKKPYFLPKTNMYGLSYTKAAIRN